MTGTTPRAAGTGGGPSAGHRSPAPDPGPTHPWLPARQRGRHRKPRSPRGALFAAGGLALTAGALGLVRLAPGPQADGGAPEAAPPVALEPTAHETPRATHAGATVPAPTASARDRDASTGAVGSPTAPVRTPGGPYGATAAETDGNLRAGGGSDDRTGAEGGAGPSAPAAGPSGASGGAATGAPHPSPPAATPPPAPTGTGAPPAPRPPSERPGVCVPVIGLCVDVLSGRTE